MSDLQTNGLANGHRRTLVPTDREVEAGAERPDYVFHAIADDAPRRRGLGALVGDWARDADPRTIEGPVAPLVVLALAGFFTQWDEVAVGVVLPEIRAEYGLSLAFVANLATQLFIIVTIIG